ncbi:MAG TPA: hypothetical protein VHE35_26570 [Kofleriaceae bacterium]|nr:hypothetical protein [Kofleriaceae bacterium]
MAGALAVAVANVAACGDDLTSDAPLAPRDGTRLAASWFAFADGARLPEPFGAFEGLFDRVEHTTCVQQPWADGVDRCTPTQVGQALYTDAACTQVVGRASVNETPTHFVGFDWVRGSAHQARLYRAGAPIAPIGAFYERRDGTCSGPLPAPVGYSYYASAGEVDVGRLPQLTIQLVGDGRLAMWVTTSTDGLWLPTSVVDTELNDPCSPGIDRDGRLRCLPDAQTTTTFADPACTHPVFVSEPSVGPPSLIVAVTGRDGCSTYHGLGDPIDTAVYSLQSDGACVARPLGGGETVFDTSGEVTPVELQRSVEPASGRRLQQIVYEGGGAHFVDVERLHDTATHADCKPAGVADRLRCLPAQIAPTATLFTSSTCAIPIDVVLDAHPTCGAASFATTPDDMAVDVLHVIGDPVATPLFTGGVGNCTPFVAPPGVTVRAVGPALDPSVFVHGVLVEGR